MEIQISKSKKTLAQTAFWIVVLFLLSPEPSHKIQLLIFGAVTTESVESGTLEELLTHAISMPLVTQQPSQMSMQMFYFKIKSLALLSALAT
jgi:hypothetical protein